jgi:hypothetical protein
MDNAQNATTLLIHERQEFRFYQIIFLEGPRKVKGNSQKSRCPAEIRTGYIPNISRKR